MAYEVSLKPGAAKDFARLDKSVQRQLRKQLEKLKEKPELGKELGVIADIDLTGFLSIRAVKGRYRILYRILRDQNKVEVWAIGKREKYDVYRAMASRSKRE
jgi:mRNA interferase RelE/StbE